jgi:hypothetical protein
VETVEADETREVELVLAAMVLAESIPAGVTGMTTA